MGIHQVVGRAAPPPPDRYLRERRLGALALAAIALSACSDGVTAPAPEEAGTTVRWNALARELVVLDRTAPPVAGRAYTYLSVAQYGAALAARGIRPGVIPSLETLRDAHSPSRAAIATASAQVLGALFPHQAARIGHELSVDLGALRGESIDIGAIERATAIGARIATGVLSRAESDGWNAVWTGDGA